VRLAKLLAASSLVLGFAVFAGVGGSIIGAAPAYADAATPTLLGTPNSTLVTLGPVAVTLTDSVVISGGSDPTGTLTFTLYDGSNALVDTETATVADNGSYSTPTGYTMPTTGTLTGTYQWDVSYSGDANNNVATDSNDPSNQVTVNSASPIIAGTPSSTLVDSSTDSFPLTDTATVSGGYNPTGTITFTLYDGSNTLVDTETATVTGNGTYTTPTGYTLPTTGTVAGTYQWDVSYSGDANNDVATDSSDPSNQVTVVTDVSGLVTFSGTVDGANGLPEAGTTVSLQDGESAVTDSNGAYVMWVLPNSSDWIQFSEGTVATQSYQMFTQGNVINIGTTNVVENFSWPAAANINVTVLDANGDPIVGETVSTNYNELINAGNEYLTDGTQVSTEIRGNPPSWPTSCVTDDNGECTFTALVGAYVSFSATYILVPGNNSYPTLSAGATLTVPGNDAQATLQFTNLALQNSDGTETGSIFIGSPNGTAITDVSVAAIPDNTLPSGAISLTGALSYDVTGLQVGATIDVTFQLPPGSDPTSIYKLQNGTYVDLSSIATISGDVVTLQLTDGGLGDSDGVANGTIVDPVVFAEATKPGAPTIGTVTANAATASASVAFTAPTMDGGSSILDYTATCSSSDGGATGSMSGSASPLQVAGLTVGDTYTCSVIANNAMGGGASSGNSSPFTLRASLIPQTINFTPPAFATVGTKATLTATGGASGLPVVFSINATSGAGVCKVSGTNGATINYLAVGKCVIDANQAGNATYAVAPTITGTTKVGKGQTIEFGPLANKTLAQSPLNVSATASSGLSVTFTTTTTTVCSAGGPNGAKITLLQAGKCTVLASQVGNTSYNPATPVSQSFTVSMASQTIIFGGLANKTLAQSPVSVRATSTSGLTVNFTSATPTVCSAEGTNGATIVLLLSGKCTVVANQAGNGTYGPATPVSQSFTVSKASQTVTFGGLANKKLPQSPVTVSATSSSGLAVTFTTTTPSVCTAGGTNGDSITLLKAGTCTVVASQAGNATYNSATPVSRSFTVSK
jgi:hypothetical protein